MLRLCKIHANRAVSVWNGLLAMSAGWGAITEFIWAGVTMVALSRSPFGGSVAVRVFCMRRGRGLHSEAGATSAPQF